MKNINTWPKSNLHTHTTYCDGVSSAEEMVLAAIDNGFTSLGFSGHSYTSFDESYCMSRENTTKYISDIKALKEKYKEKITIFCGIEQDYFAGPVSSEYDYSIGSVHAFFKEVKDTSLYTYYPEGIIKTETGFYIYADFSTEPLKWAIDTLYDGDALSLAEDYFNTVANVYDATGCDIIGHLDLITKLNESHHLFDENSPRYKSAAKKAIKKLANSPVIFEVNTGAISRGYRSIPYPSAALLKFIKESGGKITISSDCHNCRNLVVGFNQAVDIVKNCGFDTIWILKSPGIFEEITIP